MPATHSHLPRAAQTYAVIAKAIRFVDEHRGQQPALADIAKHVGLSEFHLQRLFSAWVGVSPRQYLQFLTKENAKQRLREAPVLDAALAAGLSGSSRLHDLMLSCEGMTPGEYRQGGKDVLIHYGIHESPFGTCLIASTGRGICKLAFFDSEAEHEQLETELRSEWPSAEIVRDDAITEQLLPLVFPFADQPQQQNQQPLKLLLRGSPFQLKVWEALLSIPAGEIRTYQHIADDIGMHSATRAVASAIAKNSIGYLIPCHRVIRAGGEFSNYRWGGTRKKAMIAWEASAVSAGDFESNPRAGAGNNPASVADAARIDR